MIGNVGYLLTFLISPLLVPSSDDKKEFRQEVTYNEFCLGFNYIDSSYSIATMSHIDTLTVKVKIDSLHLVPLTELSAN
jgi:hypothetical protein